MEQLGEHSNLIRGLDGDAECRRESHGRVRECCERDRRGRCLCLTRHDETCINAHARCGGGDDCLGGSWDEGEEMRAEGGPIE